MYAINKKNIIIIIIKQVLCCCFQLPIVVVLLFFFLTQEFEHKLIKPHPNVALLSWFFLVFHVLFVV